MYINYGNLETKFPFISNLMGVFVEVEFQFTKQILQTLANDINDPDVKARRTKKSIKDDEAEKYEETRWSAMQVGR